LTAATQDRSFHPYPVLIDITRLLFRRAMGTRPTGIDRVMTEYIRHYGCGRRDARAVLAVGWYAVVLSRRDSRRAFEALANLDTPVGWLSARLTAKTFLWRWVRPAPGPCFLLTTGHTGLENRRYGYFLRRQGAKLVVMVHDLIPIAFGEYCRPREFARHSTRVQTAVALSAAIVTNSQDTLDSLLAHCRELSLRPPPAVAARLAPGLQGIPPGSRKIPGPYYVFLSTIEPRKNHWMLLHVWRRIASKMGTLAPKLLIIGMRGWESENVVDLLERSRPLRSSVIEISSCSDADLVAYLHYANALLFPSFTEGYGLPVVEALSLGVPVIASDLPVFRETVGDIPDYIDSLDGPGWERRILEYAMPYSPQREAQLARMKGFRPPTWAEHFERVDGLLHDLEHSFREA